MKKIIILICSLPDSASVNMKDRLLETESWVKKEIPSVEKMNEALEKYPIFIPEKFTEEKRFSNRLTDIYELEKEKTLFQLICIDGRTIFQDGLDKRLEYLGYIGDLIVFLSKHKSQSETKALTAHPTGNYENADFGGKPFSLSKPAPIEMKKLLLVMNRLNEETNLNYDVTYEVTHHGPTELDTPSLFIEIGSTEKEWTDKNPGMIAAKAVLSLADIEEVENPDETDEMEEIKEKESALLEKNIIAVAFGGGHYAERQTAGIFKTNIAYGHMFPKHTLETITEEVILKAFENSKAEIAFFDKKSMRGPDRRRITEILEKNNIPIINDKDIVAEYGVGFNLREKQSEI